MIAILSAVALFAATAGQLVIDDPIDIAAPPKVVSDWNSYQSLPSEIAETGLIRLSGPDTEKQGRIDILRRQGKEWIWSSTIQYRPNRVIAPADYDRGILLRIENDPFYFWAEIPAQKKTGVIELKHLKNITVSDMPADVALALYSAAEEAPRSTSGLTFHYIPLRDSVVCATTNSGGSRCAEVEPDGVHVSLSFKSGGDARVLHLQPQPDDNFSVVSKGRVSIRPKRVGEVVASASSWVAIALSDKNSKWSDVLIDRSGRDLATERLEGLVLASPPAFTEVVSRHERGLVIRPYVGEHKEFLSDHDAELAVFPGDGSELSLSIVLAMVARDADDSFHMPALGSGTYSLMLYSSAASAERVTIPLTVGVPADVQFPSGPSVTGRLIRASGGFQSDPAIVEVVPDVRVTQVIQSDDPLKQIHQTTADDGGNFRVVISSPGRYRLRARWGGANGERAFEVADPPTDLNLGDISLAPGQRLHGDIAGCTGGSVAAFLLPDFSKPLEFNEVRAQIDAEGRFLFDGLHPGKWVISVVCDGKTAEVKPDLITVPPNGEMVMQFTRTP